MALNDEQRAALWDLEGKALDGQRILSARPGTGKTSTLTQYYIDVAERWHERYQPWQGLAMLSYTNVAKNELERKIYATGKASAALRDPHFVGTMDAFVNQYVFLPHGAVPMDFSGDRPTLVGEPYQQWTTPWALDKKRPQAAFTTSWFDGYTIGLDDYPTRIDETPRGSFGPVKPVTQANASKILAMKRYIWAAGLALQSDANYLAHQALLRSPALTRAVVQRFPVFIVDEAQDLTEVQHAMLDHLIAAGLQHVVLVGDENQAIYEWNTARPQLFTEKLKGGVPWIPSSLTESYRCSPAICSTLSLLAGNSAELKPAENGKNKEYADPVSVRPFKSGESEAVASAISLLASELSGRRAHEETHDDVKSVLVLARGTDHIQQIERAYSGAPAATFVKITWGHPLTRNSLKVIYHLVRDDLFGAVGAYEGLLKRLGDHRTLRDTRLALRRSWHLADEDMVGYRIRLMRDLRQMYQFVETHAPATISDCAGVFNAPLEAIERAQRLRFKADCTSFSSVAKQDQNQLLSSIFAAHDERVWRPHPDYNDVRVAFSTVHAAKGETHDAVLLVTKGRSSPCGCASSAALWAKVLAHPTEECEGKRIVYVALSRAAQSLTILTPAGNEAPWQRLAPAQLRM